MAVLAPILAAALAAAPHAAVITNPDWLKKPTGEEVRANYPALMLEIQIEGEAVIRCGVTLQGDAANCAVIFESPRGVGFGPAAVATTPLMKFTPKKINGVAVAGGIFQTAIRFRLDGPSPAPTGAVTPPANADARTRAMALRLAALMDRPLFDRVAPNHMAEVEAETTSQGDTGSRRRMIEAYLAALKGIEPRINRLHADLSLGLLTPAQLEASIAFLETPSGQVMVAKAGEADRQFTPQESAEMTTFLATDAGHAFVAAAAQVYPKILDELNSQGPALAAAALKTYCALAGACPVRDAASGAGQ